MEEKRTTTTSASRVASCKSPSRPCSSSSSSSSPSLACRITVWILVCLAVCVLSFLMAVIVWTMASYHDTVLSLQQRVERLERESTQLTVNIDSIVETKVQQLLKHKLKEEHHRTVKRSAECRCPPDVPVKRNPDILIRGREFVSRGGTIALVCNATSLSDSGQDLQWVKDGNILNWRGPGGRISITVKRSRDSPAISSFLHVHDVTLDDAGDYTCRSSDLTHMTSIRVNIATGGLSNNVKRGEFGTTGSMMLENCAVGCLPRDIAHLVLVLLMFICHQLIT